MKLTKCAEKVLVNNIALNIFFLTVFAFVLLAYSSSAGQGVGINPSGSVPNNSAGLDVNFTDKGMLIPRLTAAQRNAISSPPRGLFVYNTDCDELEYYNGNNWIGVLNSSSITAPVAISASAVGQTSFTANWNILTGATAYYLDAATDAGFTSFVSGYRNLNVGNVTSYTISGLSCNPNYYYRVRAANNGCPSGNSNTIIATTFSPSCISGLKLWLDATAITGTSNGASISSWADVSGNNNNAQQATSAKKPTYITNAQNGKPIVRFNGTSSDLVVPSLTLQTYITIFLAGKFTLAAPMFLEHGPNANISDGFYYYGSSNNGWAFVRTTNHYGNYATNWMGSNFVYVSLVYNGDGKNYLNGILQTSSLIGSASANSNVTTNLNICSRSETSAFSNGDIGEILIYNTPLSDADRQSVELYLKNKWGL